MCSALCGRLTRAQARTIADAAFPTTLLVGRHDPVAPVKWVQAAAAWLRGTLIVTGAIRRTPELIMMSSQ